MRSIIGIPPMVVDTIRSAWSWIEEQVNVADMPDDIKIPFRICFQTTVGEMMSRHYVDSLTQDEYLDTYTQCLVEDVISTVFEYDTDGRLLACISDIMDIAIYEPNTFWALVISHYMKHRTSGTVLSDDARSVKRTDREGLITALVHGMSTLIEMAIEEHEFVSELSAIPNGLVADNVEVNLSSNSIIIWS